MHVFCRSLIADADFIILKSIEKVSLTSSRMGFQVKRAKQDLAICAVLFINVIVMAQNRTTTKLSSAENKTNSFPMFLAKAIENATQLDGLQAAKFEFLYLHGRTNHVEFDSKEIDSEIGAFVNRKEYPYPIQSYFNQIPLPQSPMFLKAIQNQIQNEQYLYTTQNQARPQNTTEYQTPKQYTFEDQTKTRSEETSLYDKTTDNITQQNSYKQVYEEQQPTTPQRNFLGYSVGTTPYQDTQTLEQSSDQTLKTTQTNATQQQNYYSQFYLQQPRGYSITPQDVLDDSNVENPKINFEQSSELPEEYKFEEPRQNRSLQQGKTLRNVTETQRSFYSNSGETEQHDNSSTKNTEQNSIEENKEQRNLRGKINDSTLSDHKKQEHLLDKLTTPQTQLFSEDRNPNDTLQNATSLRNTQQNLFPFANDPKAIQSLLSKDLSQLRNEYELTVQQVQDKTKTGDAITPGSPVQYQETHRRTRRENKEMTTHNLVKRKNVQHNGQHDIKSALCKQLQKLLAKKRIKTKTKDFKKNQVRGIINKPQNDPQEKSNFTSKIFEKLFNNPVTNFLLFSSTKPTHKHGNITQDHGLLMKLEAMRYHYLEAHNECPSFVIFGTTLKSCYTFTADRNNCAEEFVEVSEVFKQSCPQTHFFIYAGQNVASKIGNDNVKSFINNDIDVLT